MSNTTKTIATNKFSTKQICLNAVFIAITFAVTRFIQVPIPLGYFNIGNTVILIACLLCPAPSGIIIGSVGSALADLTSYPVYTLPTAIIKLLFPLVFYAIAKIPMKKINSHFIAAAISTLIPLFGYTIVGGILYGGIVAGLAQFPGLFIEYIANFVLFIIIYKPTVKLSKFTN